MRTVKAVVSLIVFLYSMSLPAQELEVGEWRTHFSAGPVHEIVVRGDDVMGRMQNGMLCWNTYDGNVYWMDKTRGLSTTSLSSVLYNSTYDAVVVGYEDGTIDLVYPYGVKKIGDLADKPMSGEKKILDMVSNGRYVYMGTGFGVLLMDLAKEEIRESYFIGQNNAPLAVSSIAIDQENIYAVTENGLKMASLGSPNLNDFNAWKTLDNREPVKYCDSRDGEAFFFSDTAVLILNADTSMEEVYVCPSGSVLVSHSLGKDNLALLVRDTLGKQVGLVLLSSQGNVEGKFEVSPWAVSLHLTGNTAYVGTSAGELIRYTLKDGKSTQIKVQGPLSNDCFDLSIGDHTLMMVAGGYTSYYAPEVIPFELNIYDGENWKSLDQSDMDKAGFPYTVSSLTKAIGKPGDPAHIFAASSRAGLVEIRPDGKIIWHNPENSPLMNNNADYADCRIFGLDFDAQGNLWVLNAYADKALHKMNSQGQWEDSYDLKGTGESITRLNSLLVDYWQQKWVLYGNTGVGIYRTDGSSIEGLVVDLNEGNDLQTSHVYCMVEDDLGHMWFGTNRGVKVIDQHARMFEDPVGNKSSIHAKTVKVPRDGYLINLLGTDQVNAIAVDGANRKWLGTASNGVFLVSSDGMEEIHHFTSENSPLLSNTIIDIVVDDQSGEVFFGTDKGLISYRGTATRTEGNPEGQAIAYPNPVRPDYYGYINIKGLPNNSIVKITDAQGGLVYQGKATGGQLSWNGKNMHGLRPHSGVLFVYACGEDGSQAVVCKIFYIR